MSQVRVKSAWATENFKFQIYLLPGYQTHILFINTAIPGKGTLLYPGYNIMVNGYNIMVGGYNIRVNGYNIRGTQIFFLGFPDI